MLEGFPMRVGAAITIVAMLMLAFAGLALGQPEPDPVPRRWQLRVEPGPLRLATFDVPGAAGTPKPQAYFYLTYKVTNTSGQDILFAPSFELATSDGDIVRSGRSVPLEVTRAIISRLGNPLLQDQIQILGELLQGPENAREGVVIWPAPTLDTEEITIYAAGFSGETTSVQVPGTTDTALLRKTLMVRYPVPGELTERGDRPLAPGEQRWIMR